MPLILITGISTSGKSTIAKELVSRGYETYDTEHHGISAWFDNNTGERVAEFGEMPERTQKWLDQHEWVISKDWVTEMATKAKNEPIFLCGGSSNEPEIREMCQKVIWLKTDEATIRGRVANPRDHDYGTRSHELIKAIEENKLKETEYRDYGARLVDAMQPLSQVIDEILKISLK